MTFTCDYDIYMRLMCTNMPKMENNLCRNHFNTQLFMGSNVPIRDFNGTCTCTYLCKNSFTSTFSTTCFPNEQTFVEHEIVMFSADSYLKREAPFIIIVDYYYGVAYWLVTP